MRRVFWVAVGAAGGVFVYKRGGQLLTEARERGLISNLSAATVGAIRLIEKGATLLRRAGDGGEPASDPLTPATGASPATNHSMTQGPKGVR